MGAGFAFDNTEDFGGVNNSLTLNNTYQVIPNIDFLNVQIPSAVWIQIKNASLTENTLLGCIANPLDAVLTPVVDFYLPLNQILIFDVMSLRQLAFKEPSASAGGTLVYRFINEYSVYSNL